MRFGVSNNMLQICHRYLAKVLNETPNSGMLQIHYIKLNLFHIFNMTYIFKFGFLYAFANQCFTRFDVLDYMLYSFSLHMNSIRNVDNFRIILPTMINILDYFFFILKH